MRWRQLLSTRWGKITLGQLLMMKPRHLWTRLIIMVKLRFGWRVKWKRSSVRWWAGRRLNMNFRSWRRLRRRLLLLVVIIVTFSPRGGGTLTWFRFKCFTVPSVRLKLVGRTTPTLKFRPVGRRLTVRVLFNRLLFLFSILLKFRKPPFARRVRSRIRRLAFARGRGAFPVVRNCR